jgi:hypothetical protein
MSDIEQIEISIEHAKDMVARRDACLKLKSNRDFKKVILEGYFKDEPVRLTALLGTPGMEAHKASIIASLESISQLQQYLQTTLQLGDMAASQIGEYEVELEAIRNETAEA